jgi:hypothetical protein
MKTIQPVQIWKSGSLKEAIFLNSYVVSDNIKDSAVFYYSLLNENKENLAEGNLTMGGDDYQGWEQNEYAWDWIASQLGLVITGDELNAI